MLDAAQIKETLEKKFNVTQGGLELDNDLCRKNAITNITQNLAQQLQLHLNSANLGSSKTLSESSRGNIIRMANAESSKPSTPLTEIPTKSVIQPTTDINEEQQEENKTRSPDIINHAASSTGVVPVQRSSVVRAIENGDIIQKNDTSPDMLTPEGVSSNERRLSKSVISDQMINETDNSQAQVGDLPANTETVQTTPSAIFTNTRLVHPYLCRLYSIVVINDTKTYLYYLVNAEWMERILMTRTWTCLSKPSKLRLMPSITFLQLFKTLLLPPSTPSLNSNKEAQLRHNSSSNFSNNWPTFNRVINQFKINSEPKPPPSYKQFSNNSSSNNNNSSSSNQLDELRPK